MFSKLFGKTKPITYTLTGNYYFKQTFNGLVLMVEEMSTQDNDIVYIDFRKADLQDIFQLGLIESKKLK